MFNSSNLNFEKLNGLIPAIITDTNSTVLMLGFMNKEALIQTLETKRVTFFSRTRNKIWVKGETSGNYLKEHRLKSVWDFLLRSEKKSSFIQPRADVFKPFRL